MKERTWRKNRVLLGLFWSVIWLFFCSVPGRSETVAYSYDSAGRLAKATYGDDKEITYTYDAAGNLLSKVIAPPGQETMLVAGWNLLSLYRASSDNSILSILGDIKDDIVSVWKWQNNTWAVYLPVGGTETYAQSKGFIVLDTLVPGEGFWVNSDKAGKLNVTGGSTPADSTLNLSLGWNLVGLKSSQQESIVGFISDNVDKMVSVWKWVNNNWAVYLPAGGTEDYAGSKGFKVLFSLVPGEGFWVNCTDTVTVK